jgi:DNA-binding YbaB/EbfC family protein
MEDNMFKDLDKQGLSSLLEKFGDMNNQMQETQQKIMKIIVVGESVGGLVAITINGAYECISTKIDQQALKETKEVLQDLISSAINDAMRKLKDKMRRQMGDIAKSMGLPQDVLEGFPGSQG